MVTENKNKTQHMELTIEQGNKITEKLQNIGKYDISSEILDMSRKAREFLEKYGNSVEGHQNSWTEALFEHAFGPSRLPNCEEVLNEINTDGYKELVKRHLKPIYELTIADQSGVIQDSFVLMDDYFNRDDIERFNQVINEIIQVINNSEMTVSFHGRSTNPPIMNYFAHLNYKLKSITSLESSQIEFKNCLSGLNKNLQRTIVNEELELSDNDEINANDYEAMRNCIISLMVMLKNQKREILSCKKIWHDITSKAEDRIDDDDVHEIYRKLVKIVKNENMPEDNIGMVPYIIHGPGGMLREFEALLKNMGEYIHTTATQIDDLITELTEYTRVAIPKSINIAYRITKRKDNAIESIDKLIAIKKNKYHYKADKEQLIEIYNSLSNKFLEFDNYYSDILGDSYRKDVTLSSSFHQASIQKSGSENENLCKIGKYDTYDDLKKHIIEDLGITCYREYKEHSMIRENNVPQRPDIKFKNTGWINWDNFFVFHT